LAALPAPDDGVDDAAPPTAELIRDDACEAALATEALAPEDIAEPEAMDAMEVADAAEAIDVPERLAAMEETRDALTEVAEAPAEMEAPETPLAAATLAQRACCRASADCCSAVVQLLGLAGKGNVLRGFDSSEADHSRNETRRGGGLESRVATSARWVGAGVSIVLRVSKSHSQGASSRLTSLGGAGHNAGGDTAGAGVSVRRQSALTLEPRQSRRR